MIKGSKGFTLLLSIMTIVVVTILVGAIFAALITHIGQIAGQNDAIRAYNVAEAGLARGIIELRQFPAPPRIPPSILSWRADNNFIIDANYAGSYSVDLHDRSPSLGALRSFELVSTGTCRGINRTLHLTVFQKSFAQWAYFSDSENTPSGTPLQFYTGNIIDGPLHTNGQLSISGSPIFTGRVSSAAGSVNYNSPGSPQFQGGLFLNVPAITVPAASLIMTPLSAAASDPADGVYLTGNTTIVFKNTTPGTMTITNTAAYPTGSHTGTIALPDNGAIFIDGGNLNISGTLNGKVTVGALNQGTNGGSITVVENLKYAGPRDANGLPTDPDNMLQLVAAKNVYVLADSTVPHRDIEIDAYIIALGDSFEVKDWQTVRENGVLTVFGGIMQMHRGFVQSATFSGDPFDPFRLTGYQKDYHYDERLLLDSPLYSFPLVDDTRRIVYAKRLWEGR